VDEEGYLRKYNLIEKSKSLVWAKFQTYTAGELRLVDVYLSRINPREEASCEVKFSLAEYARLVDLQNPDPRVVKPQLDHFLGNVVTLTLPWKGKDAFVKYVLFTKARCEQDEHGKYWITISCNPDLRQVFFNLASDGYVRYRLSCTINMKSKYSIKLYCILLDWAHNPDGWKVELPVLKENMEALDKSYEDFRNFRKWVLDVAVNEINELSDLTVKYDKITVGRRVVGIHFHITRQVPNTVTVGDKTGVGTNSERFVRFTKNLFTLADAEGLLQLVRRKLKELHPGIPADKQEEAEWDVLSRAYNYLMPGGLRTKQGEEIENPMGYLWAILSRGDKVGDYLPTFYEGEFPVMDMTEEDSTAQ